MILKKIQALFIIIIFVAISLSIGSSSVFAIFVTGLEEYKDRNPYKIQFEICPTNPKREWGQDDLYYEILGSVNISPIYYCCCCKSYSEFDFTPGQDPNDHMQWTLERLRQKLFHGTEQACEAKWDLTIKIYCKGNEVVGPVIPSIQYPLSILWDRNCKVNIEEGRLDVLNVALLHT